MCSGQSAVLELPYYEVLAWLACPHCFLCLLSVSKSIAPEFYLYFSVEPKYFSILLLLVVACYGVLLWGWLMASLVCCAGQGCKGPWALQLWAQGGNSLIPAAPTPLARWLLFADNGCGVCCSPRFQFGAG